MNLPLFIARRYLLAKKSHNVINIISGISVIGVVLGTMALIVVLSVFNGFEEITESMYNTFDSELKITPQKGKSFALDSTTLLALKQLDGVKHTSEILEENVLLKYGDRQALAVMKGVEKHFDQMTNVHEAIIAGEFNLLEDRFPQGVIGGSLASRLGVGLNSYEPLVFYVPRRGASMSASAAENLNTDNLYLSGAFAIEQNFDDKYIFVPIDFARGLLEYTNQMTAIEVVVDSTYSVEKVKRNLQHLLGDSFDVKNRHEQNATLFRMIKSEKLMVYAILVFIIIIVSFNITGSLFMLIIEKKKDIITFRNIGATDKLIRQIFLFEGWLISISGMLVGLLIGLFICWLQQHYGLLKLPGGLLVDAYPVSIKWQDIVLVVASVASIGYLAAWFPITYLSKQLTDID